jgi:RNA polymerase sigma factor for flagellar operon FliA
MSSACGGRPAELDRDQLILDHVPLLQHIVGRMSYDIPGRIQRDDLFGWGMAGLIGAADSYDPSRGRHSPVPGRAGNREIGSRRPERRCPRRCRSRAHRYPRAAALACPAYR